jgi:hypothetical protein
MDAPDMNKIIGKEIAVAKAFYMPMDDKKSGYAFKEALTIDPIVMELNSVTMEALQDCVKQLEKMGSWDEVAKEQGYHDEGHKMTGLVIPSSLDPRVVMSVEFGRRWNKDSDAQAEKTGDKDVTLKWFLNDEHKDQFGVKGVEAERGATPEELDIISKIREATKLPKLESRQPVLSAIKKGYRMLGESKKISEDEVAKPIEREVTIKLTLKQAAEALGFGDWAKMSDYLDADDQEDLWHSGYSAKDAEKFNDPKGLDDATKIFPEQVAMAAEAAERSALAAEITKERHRVIEQAFEKIQPTGEYQSGDGEMISVRGCGIESCTVDAPKDEVILKIKNPEHLINDIVAGVGRFAPELDPHVAASDEEIKSGIMATADDYFAVYGDSKPKVSDRIDAGSDDDVYAEEARFRIGEMTISEIAEAVIDAVDADRIEDEKEAIALAAQLTNEPKAEIAKAVKAKHAESAEKYQKRAASVPEESVKRSGKKLSESKEKGAGMKKVQEGVVFNDWDSVDFFGVPKMESDYKPEYKPAQAPHVAAPAKKDKEVEKKAADLGGKGEPNKAGAPIAKPASELPVGVKSGEMDHKEADLKVGDAEAGRGEVVMGKGKSDDQQKELPAKKVKVGDAEDGRGEVMADSRRVSGRPMSEAMKARLVEWRKKKMAEKMGHKKMGKKAHAKK